MSSSGNPGSTTSSDDSDALTLELEHLHLDPKHEPHPALLLPELLAEIFIQYLPPYPDCPPLGGPDSPKHLLKVCRLWRDVALSSPALWRCIQVEKPRRSTVLTAEEWLSRSGAAPLSIHVEAESLGSFAQLREWHDRLFEASLLHRARWEFVHWKIDEQWIPRVSGAAPTLVELTLSATWQPPSLRSNIVLHDATRLRAVCLWNIGYRLDSLPWPQLTVLALLNTDLADCMAVLSTAKALVHCKLYLRDVGDSAVLSRVPTTIELPALETLLFDLNYHRIPDSDWLAPFVLPSLRNIAVCHPLLGPNSDVDSASVRLQWLHSLIQRSRCQRTLARIRVLWEDPDNATVNNLLDLLRATFGDAVQVDEEEDSWFVSRDADWREERYWVEPRPVPEEET